MLAPPRPMLAAAPMPGMAMAPPPPPKSEADELAAPSLSDASSRVLLELAGITFDLVPSSGFAVYLDSAGGPESGEPVGLIDIFGATHRMTMANGAMSAQRFDVTEVIRHAPGPYTLRVEPYTLLVTRDGRPGRSRVDGIRIASVRFVVIA